MKNLLTRPQLLRNFSENHSVNNKKKFMDEFEMETEKYTQKFKKKGYQQSSTNYPVFKK
jgi:uncharacterized membrane protein